MFLAEKKLAIQVAQVDSIEINDVDFGKSSEDEILQQLATDAAGTDHKHSSL